MKKFLCTIIAVILMSNLITSTSAKETITTNFKATNDSVMYITANNYDAEQLNVFMEQGGIIVSKSDSPTINKELNTSISLITEKEDTLTNTDSGKDIATLYYKYGNGLDGIYVINIGENDQVNETNLINEAISEIRDRQITYSYDAELTASNKSATALGVFDATYTRIPKGKLNVSYKIFTVQDYLSRDYYIVKATVNGMPGCVLSKTNSDYESKYQGKGMEVSIGTPTTSTTLDEFGPLRTINSTTYTVDIGGQLSDNGGFSINGGWSYSRTIVDTDIDAEFTTTLASWDVTLRSEAQETSFPFYPAATFDCPSSKTQIKINIYASYDLDSWNTLSETISLNRTITCKPSSASISS